MNSDASGVEKKEEPRLYNSIIINTFVKLIKSRYSYVNLIELLQYAEMQPYQVEDEEHWFTQRQVDRFTEHLIKMTGNVYIAREAGLYTASPEALGTMKRYVLGLLGPAKVFELLGKIVVSSYTRSAKYESKKFRNNMMEITVTPYEGVQEKPYQCANRIGYFEAIVRMFNYRMPKIEHSECLFRGDKCCRYEISWQESLAVYFKKIRTIVFLAGGLFFAYAWFFIPNIRHGYLAAGLLSFLLVLTLVTEYLDRREMVAALDNLRSSTDNLFESVSYNYNHALLVNEIGQTISKHIQVEEILSGVIELLKKHLDFDRGLILLTNKDQNRLEFRSGFGYEGDQLAILQETSFHLDNEGSRGTFVTCYKERKPFLVNDVEAIAGNLTEHSLEFTRFMGSKSFICCPILYEDSCLGVLAVDNVKTKRPLLQRDINLLMGITPELGISINNALLLEEQEQQFRSVLRTLAASIDARDFLTAGHSEKVTEYAVGICAELDLSREYTEMIRVASQLHDYGKIGIRDSILKKAGPLSDSEREEIKTHAEKTENILRQINFEGIYREVPIIAGSHHERIDGSGYPRGLRGEEIPLGARIIAVADFFEAITARRHYREPMKYEDAVSVMMEESGKHLDSVVVDAFLSYLSGIRRLGVLTRIVSNVPQSKLFLPQQLRTGV